MERSGLRGLHSHWKVNLAFPTPSAVLAAALEMSIFVTPCGRPSLCAHVHPALFASVGLFLFAFQLTSFRS